jgi:hypothetical protein
VKGGGRLEPQRGGFPSVVGYPDGSVGFASHTNYSADLTSVIYTKNNELAGETVTSTDVKPATSLDDNTLWPRTARDGKGNIHVIYTYNAGPKNAQLGYTMSSDNGKTWSSEQLFTGPDALAGEGVTDVNGAGADTYAMAAKGNTIVVVYSDEDLGFHMRKSTDNGVTWTHLGITAPDHKVVYTEPATPSEGESVYFTTDSIPSPGTNMDVIIDNEGMANVVMTVVPSTLHGNGTFTGGEVKRIGDDTTSSYNIYLSLGMWYYKEGNTTLVQMAPPAGGTYDQGGVMVSRRFGAGYSRLPQLGIDPNNNVYCVYTSIANGDSSTTRGLTGTDGTFFGGLFGHIYATHKPVGGNDWSTPIDLTPVGMDCLYGTLANNVMDGNLYYAYLADDVPGDRVTESSSTPPDATYPVVKSSVYAASFPVSGLGLVGVNDQPIAEGISLDSYPNPAANGNVKISFSGNQHGYATLEVYNSLGIKVATPYQGFSDSGAQFNFSTDNLPSGVYYYSLKWNGQTITKTMTIVR